MAPRASHFVASLSLAVCLSAGGTSASAQPKDSPGDAAKDDAAEDDSGKDPEVDEATRRGREAIKQGLELAGKGQWGDALKAFLRAAEARDHPIVQHNISICHRALGRYVAAREANRRALAEPDKLDPPSLEDAKGFQKEFEQLIVRLNVTLEPPTAKLTVDGRPLVVSAADGGALLGGIAPAGEGTAPGTKQLTVLLDPGMHLFRATRPGHEAAVVRETYKDGHKGGLDLRLDVLPANVQVLSTPPGALVLLDKRDIGPTPVRIKRPAGSYDLEVVLEDYETYTATLDLKAGQEADFTAKLAPYEAPIYTRWWFWTGAAAVVATGAVLTYVLTRPEPEPPPYDGGNTGWIAQPTLFEF